MAVMREATFHDLPGVYRVCLMTGAAGADATPLHADPDLLGHLWAGPYVVHPDTIALVVQDEEGVAGYCVGTPDTTAFEDWLDATWFPSLRERHPEGSGSTEADRGVIDWIHHPRRPSAHLVATHPAHLHIDLLPRLQGQGWGRRLMDEMARRLAAAGATGVHLGVDPGNAGATAFYERLGFTRFGDDPGTPWYGRVLEPTPETRNG